MQKKKVLKIKEKKEKSDLSFFIEFCKKVFLLIKKLKKIYSFEEDKIEKVLLDFESNLKKELELPKYDEKYVANYEKEGEKNEYSESILFKERKTMLNNIQFKTSFFNHIITEEIQKYKNLSEELSEKEYVFERKPGQYNEYGINFKESNEWKRNINSVDIRKIEILKVVEKNLLY